MNFDPENPVIRLCSEGIMSEHLEDVARKKYQEAMNIAGDDFEIALAAHYLARVQESLSDRARLNLRAIEHALKSPEKCIGFLPSLYLNSAKDYEDMGKKELALNYYTMARDATTAFKGSEYESMIRQGIEAGLKRMMNE